MLEFVNVSAAYDEKTILRNVSFRLERGEHAAFMGPSGCGKTTLLYLAAGLKAPYNGRILRDTEKLAAVFQEPRLFPWMNALENVSIVLGKDRDAQEKAIGALTRARLGAEQQKFPSELSGGMQQRVSLARALASDGDLLLLDEPIKGLDETLREDMTEWIKEASRGKTMLLITHDPKDAAALCDSLYEFRDLNFFRKPPV